MAELIRVAKTGINISVPAEVLAYTYTGVKVREVVARVDIGVGTGLLTGLGGTYVLDFYIDGVLITPSSEIFVPVGKNRTIMVGRSIPIEVGDVVSIQVTGTAGDVNINTLATLRDATPILEGDIKGAGAVLVDHNTGGSNELQVVTPNGDGILGVSINAYLASDYNSGNRASSLVRGHALTDLNGQWVSPMSLDPDSYVLVFSKQAEYTTNTRTIQVA